MAETVDRQRALLDRAYEAYDNDTRTSPVLDSCIRLSRVRGDWTNTWILTKEAIDHSDKRALRDLVAEVIGAIGRPAFDAMSASVQADWVERHRYDPAGAEPMMDPQGARQLEGHLEFLELMLDRLPPPAFDGNEHEHEQFRDETAAFEVARAATGEILGRIRQRCHTFLVQTEAAIGVTEAAHDAFSRIRERVDGRLATTAPDALSEFRAAYERAASGDPAALSQALLSCRRVLKSLADAIYPATGETVTGGDGLRHEMTEDKYINRLVQWASERIPSGASRRLTTASVEELGRRLDGVQELASKGVHDEVTQAEADQCIAQTYLLAADFLTLPDEADVVIEATAGTVS